MRGLIFSLAVLTVPTAAFAAELSLSFPELKAGGQVSVAVFARAEDWRSRKQPVWTETVRIQPGETQLTRDLPPGRYAVMAYHDRNGNGRLDTLPIGLPTEPYGFSNDARGLFGPANWSEAAFSLPPTGLRQSIRLR